MTHPMTHALAAAAVFVILAGSAAAEPAFEGRKKCSSCHKSQADSWGETAHAKAIDSLRADTKNKDKNKAKLKAKLDRGEEFVLVDVREPGEYEICRLPGAKLIPLAQLPERVNELDTADEIVVHCKMGGRSARAVQFLRQAGFGKAINLAGGIEAWSQRIDPAVPQY